MTQPLALVLYEKLMPGTRLVNRLQDLGYRVLTVPEANSVASAVTREKPMLLLADLASSNKGVIDAISDLRKNPDTNHLPVIAFAEERDTKTQEAARGAGATLVVSENALLAHLEQFLEQALQVD